MGLPPDVNVPSLLALPIPRFRCSTGHATAPFSASHGAFCAFLCPWPF
jgi:hypothetical protein